MRRIRSGLLAALLAVAACSSSTGAPSAPVTARPHVTSIAVGPQPDALTYLDGSIWVADYGGTQVVRIDPRTGRVLARITVGSAPIWIDGDRSAVWVANYDAATVSRIDPARNRVTDTIPVGSEPEGLAITGHMLWVTNQLDGTISRIDTRTARPVGTLHVGGEPIYITADGPLLWLTNSDEQAFSFHKVVRLDARTGAASATRSLGRLPFHAVPAFGSIWVSDYQANAVYRLDPHSLTTVARIDVGKNPDAVYADRSSVWVDNDGSASLTRIDPGTNRVTQVVRLPGAPRSMVRIGNVLWVAGFDDGVVYRVPIT
jgi:YVTN family beta-propeller protein